jgi:hypothetical protein
MRSKTEPAIAAATSEPETAHAVTEAAPPAAPDAAGRQARASKDSEKNTDGAGARHEPAAAAQPAMPGREPAPLPPPAAVSPSGHMQAVESRPASDSAAADGARNAEIAQPEQRKQAVEPLRDLSLRLTGAARERVDVRLMDRGGELRVAVRTPDADLARGLRSGLADLVGRLDSQGLQTETWRPAEAGFSQAREQGSGSRDTFSGGRHGNSQEPGGGSGQQNQPQPRWVEEIEEQLGRKPGEERRPFSWARP